MGSIKKRQRRGSQRPVIRSFVTIHRPRDHQAVMPGGGLLVPSVPTEIELVQKLQRMGIRLKRYRYFNNRGDEQFMTINWELLPCEK